MSGHKWREPTAKERSLFCQTVEQLLGRSWTVTRICDREGCDHFQYTTVEKAAP